MDKIIMKEVYDNLDRGKKAALVTITQNSGSSPRKSGSMMAVLENGETIGSIGGGVIELEVLKRCKECFEKEEDESFEYDLTENGLGMICGGQIKGFIKILKPEPKLLIVGGGHIGEYLYKIGRLLNFYTVVFDDREEYANRDRFKDADEIILGDIERNLAEYNIDKECYIPIATRGEPDLGALRAVVSREAAYIGMIGSRRKIALILKQLMEEGVPKEDLEKVYAPMGIDFASELPQEVALAVMAEIMLIKNKGCLSHRKESRKVNL